MAMPAAVVAVIPLSKERRLEDRSCVFMLSMDSRGPGRSFQAMKPGTLVLVSRRAEVSAGCG